MATNPDEEFLHEPPVMEDDPHGLFCFMNMDRPCSADCMAYTPYDSESKYLPDQAKNCTILVSVERLGRFTGGIMKVLKDREGKGDADEG
jgi:hypothetical protein